MTNSPGKFIVFEGMDGSGKTTQLALIAEWLKGKTARPIVCTREPGDTVLGKKIRELILNNEIDGLTELLLFNADRRQHVTEVIMPALQSGAIVLCDRFTMSTRVYQGYGKGVDQNMIICGNIVGRGGSRSGCVPDLTLVLSVKLSTAIERVKARGDKDKFENETFLEKIHAGYRKETDKFDDCIIINVEQSIEDVTADIQKVLIEYLQL